MVCFFLLRFHFQFFIPFIRDNYDVCIRKWGVGDDLMDERRKIFVKDFRKWFLDKTGNMWEDRVNFTQVPGKCTLVMESDPEGMMIMR